MKLKVCQIIPTLVQGGAEKQMVLLASHLDPSLFECHVIVLTHSGPWEPELKRSGIEVHVIGKHGKFDPLALLRLSRTLRKLSPHIVHTWLFAANSYGRVAARLAGIPIVMASERCVDPWKGNVHYYIDRWLAGWTRCITTNSQGVVDFYANRGLPRSQFRVIPNAIESARPSISREEFFKRLRLPHRAYVVGAVGRLWPQKGYPDLIWAAELLRLAMSHSDHSPHQLWFLIFGDGPDRTHLQTLRDKYGAQNVVHFTGHRSDVHELISCLDVLWNGSLYEGQSNTIMEAMNSGIPVVATDIPGNRDLLRHGQTGYLYPTGEVAQLAKLTSKLLRDPLLRRSMGEQAKTCIKELHSLPTMVAEYEKIYQDLSESLS